MFSWLKKHFIPHEGNEYRPHILRDIGVRNIAIFIIFLEIFSFLIPVFSHLNITGGMAAVLPAILSSLTNEERQIQKLDTLVVNPVLNKAAEMKAEDMAQKGYFAHTSPEGKTPWYWLEEVGYDYQYAGENLAINFSDSKDVTDAWMKSPTHRANIVKGKYTEMGTGIATGYYQGKETVFVAQVYANPALKIFTEEKIIKPIVKKVEKVSVNKENVKVLGEETEKVSNIVNIDKLKITPTIQPTFLQKLFASPRSTMNIVLYVVFGILVFALLLYISIKMRDHHKDLITNGLVVLALIGAVFVINYYLSRNNMTVLESINYGIKI